MDKGRSRDASLELIRIIAMIFVMCIHAIRKPFEMGTLQDAILSTLIYLCNGWFYMLSGQLNLSKKYESATDIKKYYASRFITIVLPFLAISMMLTFYEYATNTESFSCLMWLKWCYAAIMNSNASGHMWFLYPLIGFILSTPVLAKAFQNMSNNELTIVLIAGVIWNVFQAYLGGITGIGFRFSGWILGNWALAYFAGYYIWRVITADNSKWILVLGGVGACVTVVARWKWYNVFYGTFDISIAYVFYAMASYYLMSKCVHIINKNVAGVIRFVAKYSFMMYLVHDFINYNIVDRILKVESDGIYYVVAVALMFILSFAVSWVIDSVVVFPVTKKLRLLLKV